MVDTLLSSLRNQNHLTKRKQDAMHNELLVKMSAVYSPIYVLIEKDSLDYIWRMYTKLPFYSPSNRNSLKTEAKTFKDIFL